MNYNVVSKAERETFWLSTGERLYDLTGGFGYQIPEVREAVVNQVKNKVGLSSRVLLSTPLLELCEELSNWLGAPYENSYVCNSGDEAFEGALKLARAINPRRKTLVYVDGNNYGQMSYGQLSKRSFTEKESLDYLGVRVRHISNEFELENFGEWDDCFAFCHGPFINSKNAGRILMSPSVISRAQQAASRRGVLNIYSDLDTCLGHLGHKLSHEYIGGSPDVIVMGGSLSGGFIPVGTYTTRHELASKVYGSSSPAKHGSTTAGNFPACTAALAALCFTQKQALWDNASENGKLIEQMLSEFNPQRFGGWVSLTFGNDALANDIYKRLMGEGFHLCPPESDELIIRPPLTARKEVVTNIACSILELLKNANEEVA
ncbi:MAG: aminotransferase class III-fold pyridoxal phosphate-dependent enzyme [Pseudomonas sp.]